MIPDHTTIQVRGSSRNWSVFLERPNTGRHEKACSTDTCSGETCTTGTCSGETSSTDTCSGETCTTGTCSGETSSTDTCSGETCSTGTCSSEACSTESQIKCHRNQVASVQPQITNDNHTPIQSDILTVTTKMLRSDSKITKCRRWCVWTATQRFRCMDKETEITT